MFKAAKHVLLTSLTIGFLVGCAPSYQHLSWSFDQQQNATLAQTKTDFVVASGMDLAQRGWTLKLGAYFVTAGDRVKRPDSVVLKFASHAGNEQYPPGQSLELMVSGERVPIGQLTREVSKSGGYVVETLTVGVPFETFLKIATATDVSGRLYATPFQLRPDDMDALKLFATEVAAIR